MFKASDKTTLVENEEVGKEPGSFDKTEMVKVRKGMSMLFLK